MKKNILIVINLFVILFFSGCDSFSLPEEMIQKPKMDKKIGAVAEEVVSKFPASYEIILPKSTENSAAINYADLTGDGKDEMIVLYKEKEKLNEYGVRIYKEYINKWEYMDTVSISGFDIQELIFKDLDDDNKAEMIVMALEQGDNIDFRINMEVYVELKEKMKKLFYVQCDDVKIIDLDNDSIQDVVTLDRTEDSVKAVLYNISSSEQKKINEIFIKSDRYVRTLSSNAGKVMEDRNGIVLDMPFGSYQGYTEIIVKEDGKIKKIFSKDEVDENGFGITQSIAATKNEDIDGDGIIEMNILHDQGKFDEGVNNPIIQKWYNWNGKNGITHKTDIYFDSTKGFRFFIPNQWKDNYIIEINGAEKIQYVFIYEKYGYPLLKNEIARIAVVKKGYETEFKQKGINAAREYVKIGENLGEVYFLENNNDSDYITENLKVDDNVIIENFKILR